MVANGVVYVGAWDGKLYAFNATTGAKLWSAETAQPIKTGAVVADGMVFVVSSGGLLSGDEALLYAYRLPTP